MKLHGTLVVLLLASISCINAGDGDETPDNKTPAPDAGPAASTSTSTTTPPPTAKTTGCAHRPIPDELKGDKQKPVPELDKVFETIIEATFTKGNYAGKTMEIKEYYDQKTNKAAVYILADGKETRRLYDIGNLYTFVATKDKDKDDFTCDDGTEITEETTSSAKHSYFDFSKNDDGHGTVKGFVDAFKLGGTGDEKNDYLGEKEIRGIPVEEWSTCVKWEDAHDGTNFYIDWYFSKGDHSMPMGGDNKAVPVRLEVIGFDGDDKAGAPIEEKDRKYHMIYDFVSYKDSISDYSVFWPELKTLCGSDTYYTKRNADAKTPTIKDTFSVNMEQIKDDKTVTNGKYVMDKTNNLMRMDIEIKEDQNSNYKDKCKVNGMCKIIHDYNVGIEYLFDSTGQCRISAIEVKKEGDDSGPSDAIIDTGHKDKENKTSYIMMATAGQLFQIGSNKKIQYQGQRKFRGIDTDAYVVVDNAATNGPYREFSFTTGDSPKLFGYLENSDKSHIRTNFYNFDEKPDMSAFDIHDCFPESMMDKDKKEKDFKILHGKLELEETWDKVKAAGLVNVHPRIRKVLAQKAGVNTLRITDMLISPEDGKPDGKATTTVWFTLLGPSPVSGYVWPAPDGAQPTKETDKAGEDLEEGLEDNVVITFNTMGTDKTNVTHTFTLNGDSLKLDDDAMTGDPRPSAPASKSGYSTGNMALCGIISIVFGAFIGLGIGFYLWKRRNRGVPYQIHH